MKHFTRHLVTFLTAAMMAAAAVSPVSAGWERQTDNTWQYTRNGQAVSGGWQQIDGSWYWFDQNGTMQTGWLETGGSHYFLSETGAMVTGWALADGNWYWFHSSGAMATGWVNSGGSWYFLDGEGVMQTGAIQVDGVNYLFDSTGKMTAEGDAVVAIPRRAYTRSGGKAEVVYGKKDGTTVRVTTFENDSVEKMAQRLNDAGVCPYDQFLAAVNRVQGVDLDSEIPDGLCYRYEGYLYPDTYEFYRYEDADTVVKKMLQNFEWRVDESLREQLADAGYTLHEAVTLASVIQAEAGTTEAMAAVSGIFQNRLANPAEYPKLQSNPTSTYAQKVVLPATGNQQLADRYDSYKTNGLIAGPINNPGLGAFKAILSPAEESEGQYFFCTDKAGNFYFASTYAEHLENCKKAGLVS